MQRYQNTVYLVKGYAVFFVYIPNFVLPKGSFINFAQYIYKS